MKITFQDDNSVLAQKKRLVDIRFDDLKYMPDGVYVGYCPVNNSTILVRVGNGIVFYLTSGRHTTENETFIAELVRQSNNFPYKANRVAWGKHKFRFYLDY